MSSALGSLPSLHSRPGTPGRGWSAPHLGEGGSWEGGARKEPLQEAGSHFGDAQPFVLWCPGEQKKATRVGKRKTSPQSLYKNEPSCLPRSCGRLLPLSEREQGPLRPEIPTWASLQSVTMELEILMERGTLQCLVFFETTTKKQSTRNLTVYVAPMFPFCLTVTPGELKGQF